MLKILEEALNEWTSLTRYGDCVFDTSEILAKLEEAGMKPARYVNTKAIEDGFEVDTWKGHVQYISKYPHHRYLDGRPYEYYLEGWEPEDE